MFKDLYFADPEYFILVIIIPVVLFFWYRFGKLTQATLKQSSLSLLKFNRSFIARLRPFLYAIRIIVILLLITAISRPQSKSTSKRIKSSRGIDIVMVIDISSSMLSKDLKPDRLTALKNVASNFIDDRPNDRIGLVVYAAESYTKTPVTTDKLILKQSLSDINYESLLEDGTAIGMGLSTAVNRLKESTAKSKVIILLTDGVNNSGFIDPRIADEFNVKLLDINEIFEKADVISIHLPLTPTTKNLLNYETFKKMQKQPIIINSSRGSIINEEDLLKAYDEKLISGFGLDVYETEPVTKSFLNNIKDNTNCILTPHVAGVTEESNIRVSDFIANSVREFFKL